MAATLTGPGYFIDHPGFKEVGRLMRDVVELYHRDVQPLAGLSADEIFAYVERIPYVFDRDVWGAEAEAIARPARFNELEGLDCKKKAIFIACWARCNRIDYRFWAVDDTGAGISHVFCEIEEAPGYWVSMDCTLKGLFKPGAAMPAIKYAEVI